MLGLSYSSKWDCGSYIISVAKTASKKIGSLIRSMTFLSPEIALCICKSTIRPSLEYCCHVWAGAPSCYVELLDKLQKRICRTVVPSLAAFLEPLAYRLILKGGLLIILIYCMIFLSSLLDVTRMSMSTVSFLAQLDSGILYLQNAFL